MTGSISIRQSVMLPMVGPAPGAVGPIILYNSAGLPRSSQTVASTALPIGIRPSIRAISVVNAPRRADLLNYAPGVTTGTFELVGGKFGAARRTTRGSYQREAYAIRGFSGDFTLAFVGGILSYNTGIQTIIRVMASTTERMFIGEYSNNSMTARITPNGGTATQINIGQSGAEDIWAVRLSGTTLTLWKNGVQRTSGTQTVSNFSDLTSLQVGCVDFATDVTANVYGVGLFPYAFTDAEMTVYYNNPWSVLGCNPVNLWGAR